MEEIFEVNANEGIEDMDFCDFIQDTPPTPTTPRKPPVTFTLLNAPPIHYTILKAHSFTPPSSKQNQPPKEESNFKTIIPKSTNPTPTTSQPTTTIPSTATLKPKGSLQIINPQTNEKIIPTTSYVTFSYPIKTPATTTMYAHGFIHFSHYISKNNCGATEIHPTKA